MSETSAERAVGVAADVIGDHAETLGHANSDFARCRCNGVTYERDQFNEHVATAVMEAIAEDREHATDHGCSPAPEPSSLSAEAALRKRVEEALARTHKHGEYRTREAVFAALDADRPATETNTQDSAEETR